MHHFVSDSLSALLQLEHPVEVGAIPPASQRKPRDQVWTAQLPRVVFFWHFLSTESHEDPLSQSSDGLIFRVRHFFLQKLLAGQGLKGRQIVLTKQLVDLGPHLLLFVAQLFFGRRVRIRRRILFGLSRGFLRFFSLRVHHGLRIKFNIHRIHDFFLSFTSRLDFRIGCFLVLSVAGGLGAWVGILVWVVVAVSLVCDLVASFLLCVLIWGLCVHTCAKRWQLSWTNFAF